LYTASAKRAKKGDNDKKGGDVEKKKPGGGGTDREVGIEPRGAQVNMLLSCHLAITFPLYLYRPPAVREYTWRAVLMLDPCRHA
jgi:hypothetical protein